MGNEQKRDSLVIRNGMRRRRREERKRGRERKEKKKKEKEGEGGERRGVWMHGWVDGASAEKGKELQGGSITMA